MTKKHYVALVGILKRYPQIANNKDFISDLMAYFKLDNSNFQSDKFTDALEK